jgi:hypothetical protein
VDENYLLEKIILQKKRVGYFPTSKQQTNETYNLHIRSKIDRRGNKSRMFE